jgi:hypothetical protein
LEALPVHISRHKGISAMRTPSLLAICAVLLLCSVSFGAAETIDNPSYAHWSGLGPGSYAILLSTTESNGATTESEVTNTLLEVTAERAVIEVHVKVRMGGRSIEMPAQKIEIPAKIEKPSAEADGKRVEIDKGKAELKVGEKKLATLWTKTKMQEEGMTVTSTAWTSDAVPGQTVKTITETTGDMTMRTETMLIDFKAEPNDSSAASTPAPLP